MLYMVLVEALSANFLGIVLSIIGRVQKDKRPVLAKRLYLAAIIIDCISLISQISFITRIQANSDNYAKSAVSTTIAVHTYTILFLIGAIIIILTLRAEVGKKKKSPDPLAFEEIKPSNSVIAYRLDSVIDQTRLNKLSKDMLNVEIEFSRTFCEFYGMVLGKSKVSTQVMQASLPLGQLFYEYGVLLVNKELRKNKLEESRRAVFAVLAKRRKDDPKAYDSVLDTSPKKWKENILATVGKVTGVGDMADKVYGQYFSKIEKLVSEWGKELA